jgi:hypothetical protein
MVLELQVHKKARESQAPALHYFTSNLERPLLNIRSYMLSD